MALVEITGLADQVAELGAFKAPRRPVDLGVRTRPRLVRKYRRKNLTERPVKPGIVGDDEIGRRDQRPHGLHVDHLP
ncbi:hypothetical protein D3C73_935830 [compost metagenome]